ncbi:MAG: HAD family hydrolase [Candidatus Latescibacterota bacterium]|nr:HAD family hydrolase [Candidatus Latescibacterota bacterium]
MTHHLGIISNVWEKPAKFEHSLQTACIFDYFEHIVWSSEYHKSKPFQDLFGAATNYWNVQPDRILFVGDDPIRDALGTKAVGIRCIWVNATSFSLPEGCLEPDLVVSELPDLLHK